MYNEVCACAFVCNVYRMKLCQVHVYYHRCCHRWFQGDCTSDFSLSGQQQDTRQFSHFRLVRAVELTSVTSEMFNTNLNMPSEKGSHVDKPSILIFGCQAGI